MSWELMPRGANVQGADVLVRPYVLVRANVLLGTNVLCIVRKTRESRTPFLPFFGQNPMRPKKGLYLVLVQKYRKYPKSEEEKKPMS